MELLPLAFSFSRKSRWISRHTRGAPSVAHLPGRRLGRIPPGWQVVAEQGRRGLSAKRLYVPKTVENPKPNGRCKKNRDRRFFVLKPAGIRRKFRLLLQVPPPGWDLSDRGRQAGGFDWRRLGWVGRPPWIWLEKVERSRGSNALTYRSSTDQPAGGLPQSGVGRYRRMGGETTGQPVRCAKRGSTGQDGLRFRRNRVRSTGVLPAT